MMHCNGKCQLYKQLKKAAEEEAENNRLPIAVLKLKQLDTFILNDLVWQCSEYNATTEKHNSIFLESNIVKGYCLSLYKPPQLHYTSSKMT